MTQIKKMIKNGYADFSNEVQNETKEVYKKEKTTKGTWGAIITNYVTAKQFHRVFFNFSDNKLEIKSLKVGNVINLRNERKLDNTTSAMYDQYFLIIGIDDNEITLEKHPTVAKAIRAQKIVNFTSANVVPVTVLPSKLFSNNPFFY